MLDYRELKSVDLKLYLQSGSSIKIENLVIKPYTLEEIRDYGYTNYMQNLQLISVSVDDFLSSVEDKNKQAILEEQRANLKAFDFYVTLGGLEFLRKLIKALTMIFRTEDVVLLNKDSIAINFVKNEVLEANEEGELFINYEKLEALNEEQLTLVHRDNFDEIVEIVKLQNYLTKPKEEKEELYADEETRKLMEDMERHRKRVEAKKRAQKEADGEEDVDISDIISAVSSKSNSINKLNIWQFTLYQIYDEYSRLELIDNYDFSIRALMAGAEKIDLKHWSSKL